MPSAARTNDLVTNVAAFCGVLRSEHRFAVGQAEAHDALRALEAIGVADYERVRSALRLVCCATREETLVFDRAFDAFFFAPADGLPQHAYAPRHTRPGYERAAPQPERTDKPPDAPVPSETEGAATAMVERRLRDEETDPATTWQMLRARYSPSAGAAAAPRIRICDYDAMLAAADRLIDAVRRGRTRRWQTDQHGRRFDIRRTIRASLPTGGDPVDLHFLGHPHKNPRFVILIDASRSTSEQRDPMIAFACALSERSRRTHVFFFSTELRDVTRELRTARVTGAPIEGLGQAWGGGTKIGANLDLFLARYGSELLSPDTLVIVFSDGLDAGDIAQLERALRIIERRSAGIVWLNPHAALPGYLPTARAMRAALPFISIFAAASDAPGFAILAQRVARHPRIAARRR